MLAFFWAVMRQLEFLHPVIFTKNKGLNAGFRKIRFKLAANSVLLVLCALTVDQEIQCGGDGSGVLYLI